KPHPIFVIALVGPEETPFGIQKDFLCAKSVFYRKYFNENRSGDLENLVRLPNTAVEVFAYAQNFLFTDSVFPNLDNFPTYEVLIGVWKLGYDLGIEGLCDATLKAMSECRRITQHIPATPLLVQVWKDTPEGSSIRKLLLSWAAEYMRSSESRAEFARSLPQEVLSELVVAMSSLDTTPLIQLQSAPVAPTTSLRRTAQQMEGDESESAESQPVVKKQRHSDVLPANSAPPAPTIAKLAAKKPGPRQSLPSSKPPPKRRSNAAFLGEQSFSTNQKLNFCADLLTRMLSGPGFWTRLVGPFKEPVDPVSDGVPDYHDKVKKPMDLGTMKAKMDRREYGDEIEFLADMNQIFTNCYTYWSKKDPMWSACERLQKTFEEKYSQMNKWISKMEGDEGH
ncbi:Bromodomain-containing protein, partial [Lasiosphaeris hirsuta]